MSEVKTRKRAPTWTPQEKEALVKAVAKKIKILDSQHCNDVTMKAKKEAYSSITSAVNAIGNFKRKVQSVKEKWQSEKSRVKGAQAEYVRRKKRSETQTGGGPIEDIEPPDFDELDREILKLIPPEAYEGIESSSATSSEEESDDAASNGM